MSNLVLTEKHEYLLDGVRIPGVTEILKEAGLSDLSMVNPEILERNSAFGTASHKAIEYECRGSLDWENLDPELRPYVQAWRNFVEDYGFIVEATEVRGYSKLYRFGYTMDHKGIITNGTLIGKAIVDVKTGQPYPSHKYQMGGYAIGAGKEYQNIILLYLNPEFKPRGYKVVFAKNNKREQSVFLAALSLYNIRKEEGLI